MKPWTRGSRRTVCSTQPNLSANHAGSPSAPVGQKSADSVFNGEPFIHRSQQNTDTVSVLPMGPVYQRMNEHSELVDPQMPLSAAWQVLPRRASWNCCYDPYRPQR